MNINYSKFTNKGNREINEDSIGIQTFCKDVCFVLCDGLGGHGAGDIASSTAVKVFCDNFAEFIGDIESFYISAFDKAQEAIIQKQNGTQKFSLMKTTVASLILCDDKCRWAHIGDSRVYYFKKSKIISHTSDHSVPQMLYKAGDITEDEIRFHPDRNKLLRALGVNSDKPKYVISDEITIESGDSFLLCSDGFWEYIDEKNMELCRMNGENCAQWLNNMCKIIKKNGNNQNMDNLSAIAVDIL